jgi:UDP-N-acetylmuramate--alanine ligase
MSHLPLDIGIIHFAGIGGIGMSGIAEILHSQGYKVQGSDITENANIKRLREIGINVFIGQKKENLDAVSVIVYSSAVKADNPEMVEARFRKIPRVRRAEMLAELMRLKNTVAIAGTHGKTTTTSMVAALLDGAGIDPTVVNGGIINDYKTNARLGQGDWMVVEADESDGSFLKLPSTLAIITNMDPEHLEHYGSAEAMYQAYIQFIENIPFYGAAIMCIDHPKVQEIIGQIQDRRIITYGFSPQADIRAINVQYEINGSRFDIEVYNRKLEHRHILKDVFLPMTGKHNIQNALAAMAVGLELKINPVKLIESLSSFGGVKRRFTYVGHYNGAKIIDDYGHHPVEIKNVLLAARQTGAFKVIAIVQPHRYTRLQSLFTEFCSCMNDADKVYIADVYAAGETPIEGINAEALVEGLRNHGHRAAFKLESTDVISQLLKEQVNEGDLVIFLGAGSVTYWAYDLVKELKAVA